MVGSWVSFSIPEPRRVCNHCESGIVLNAFHILLYLILRGGFRSRSYYYLHFAQWTLMEELTDVSLKSRDTLNIPGL